MLFYIINQVIKKLLLDRNFDNVAIHALLQKRGVRYIMPKVINGKQLKEYQEIAENLPRCDDVLLKRYTERRENKNVTMNLIFIKKRNKNYKKKNYNGKDKGKKYIAYCFCTNLPIKSTSAALEIEETYRLVREYRETGE